MQQTFPAGATQNLIVSDISGDLFIQGWDQQSIQVDSEREISGLRQKGDALILNDCRVPIKLSVPFETQVTVRDISGRVALSEVRQVSLNDVRGGVEVNAINGDVRIHDVAQGVTLKAVRGSH
jgi:hypothetical protein